MNPLHPFEIKTLDYIEEHKLIGPGENILVAVSGGPDSTALLRVLYSLRESLEIARLGVLHFDHKLRGSDSDEDRTFVERLSKDLGISCASKIEDVKEFQKNRHASLEMAARECRHRFFSESMERFNAQRLALGHTANDQAEELILRLLRGSGPSGSAGMLPKTAGGLIRPLLFATRRQILGYLQDTGSNFRQDMSNLDPFCQRNALRLEIFPTLEKRFNKRIVETLSRHARLVQDEEDYWDQEIRALWPRILIEENPSRMALLIPELIRLHPALERRVLRFAIERFRGNLLGIYAVHIEALCLWLLRARSGSGLHLPGGLRAQRSQDEIVFFKAASTGRRCSLAPASIEIPGPGSYSFLDFQIDLSLEEISPDDSSKPAPALPSNTVRMDADRIDWPLLIRWWQPGDRFRPLGLGGSKKLQDFFTDAKIAVFERNRIPLLCDREKICWVAGYRLDERVKLSPGTRRVLVVRVRGNGS